MFAKLRAAVILLCLATAAQAHDKYASMWVGDLLIHTPVLRVTPEGAPVAGGYMAVENTGASAELLISASTEAAEEVQLHEMVMDGDVMKMRAVAGGIPIAAGETVRLQPGGLHLMLMRPTEALAEGAKYNVTLEFQNAGTVTLPFTVAPLKDIRELGKDKGHDHGGHDHAN